MRARTMDFETEKSWPHEEHPWVSAETLLRISNNFDSLVLKIARLAL